MADWFLSNAPTTSTDGTVKVDPNAAANWFTNNQPKQLPNPPNNGPGNPVLDKTIEFVRPLVSDAVGLGAGMLSGPGTAGLASVPIGIAAKTGVDALLQHLESKPPTSLLQKGMELDPNSISGTLANSAEMQGTNWGLGKILGGLGKVVRDVDIPQGLKNLGSDFMTQSVANWRKYVGVGIPLHLLASAVSPELGKGTTTAIAGIRLTTAAAKAIAKNPEAKQALDSLINGAPLKGSQEAAARIVTDALNGTSLITSGPGGDKNVTLKDGKFVPLQ